MRARLQPFSPPTIIQRPAYEVESLRDKKFPLSTGVGDPEPPVRGVQSLSRQEKLILSLAAQGLADKEIAREIGISMGTVRTYWQRMRDKTNSRSRSEILSRSFQKSFSETVGDLEQMTRRQFAVFEGTSVGLALLNEHDEIVEVNSAFARLLGRAAEELCGVPLRGVANVSDTGLSSGLEHCEHGLLLEVGDKSFHARKREVEIDGRPFHVMTVLPSTRIAESIFLA